MNKTYIAPKISMYMTCSGNFLQVDPHLYGGETSGTRTLYMGGKERGDAQDDNSSSGKEDWGYHRSMWD